MTLAVLLAVAALWLLVWGPERASAARRSGHASRNAEVAALEGEIAYLRQQNEALLRQVTALAGVRSEAAVRVERAVAGLPEIPPDLNPRARAHPMTPELRAWICAFQSPVSREAAAARANQLLRQLPASEVLAELKREQEGGEDAEREG